MNSQTLVLSFLRLLARLGTYTVSPFFSLVQELVAWSPSFDSDEVRLVR